MVPGIVLWPAGRTRRNPLLLHVAINIPLVTSGDAAFVTPDEALAAGELVDVKFQRLRVGDRTRVEVNVVDEITRALGQGIAVVGQPYRRIRADQMVVPEDVGVGPCAPYVVFRGIAVERRGAMSCGPVPIHQIVRGRATAADSPRR